MQEIVLSSRAEKFLIFLFPDSGDQRPLGRQRQRQREVGNVLYYLPTVLVYGCLLYTSPSPRDRQKSRMPSSA